MSRVSQDTPRASPRRGLSLSGLLDVAVKSHRNAAAVLIAVALLAFLPGFTRIPPVDRDEARFAQASKQMIESGDYIDIRFQDESRYKKPVGIYWLQAAVVEIAQAVGVPHARETISLYRIPSLIGAIGAVLLTYWSALAFVSRRAAVLAGVLMATSILLGVEARLAKTDAALLACCVAAMGAFGRAYLAGQGARIETRPWTLAAIFWTALAAGILIKGPLILMFVALPAIALTAIDRSAGWLRYLKPLPGILWMLVLVLPWFLAIVSRSGLNFFSEAIGHDLVAKVASGQESHGVPPGAYFLLFWVTFFPGSIIAGLTFPAIWRARREAGAKFLLAWIVPAWIVFEIVVTKLPHYVLPLYPAIAILIAGIVDHHGLSQRAWLMRGTVWWFLLAIVFAAIVVAVPIVLDQRLGLLAWPFVAGAMIFAFMAWWLYENDGAETALMRAAVASILISAAAYGAMLARSSALFPAAQIARAVRGADCPATVAAAGYGEPSLVFLVGTSMRDADGPGAADFLYQGGCRFAVVESAQEKAFAQRAEAIGLRYTLVRRVDGVNVGNTHRISVAVFRTASTP